MHLGFWEIDDLLTFTAQTHDPTTGDDADADSVPTYRVYENETGTPILTGSTAKLDDANTVGFYSEQITLSAANGFEVGKCYHIRTYATVGGVTASKVDSFQLITVTDAPTNFADMAITATTGRVTIAAGQIAFKKNIAHMVTFTMFLTGTRTLGTGLTVTGTASKDGAAFAGLSGSPSISEIGSTGNYKVTVASADFNCDNLILAFTATGATDTPPIHIVTQP